MDLVVATNNQGKLAEIKKILGNYFNNIFSLKELNIICEPEEDADTFLGNALIKARAIQGYTDFCVLADDSGLCVDALDGAPGVLSARFSATGTDKDNNALLLEKLKCVVKAQRGARFVSAVVLHFKDNSYVSATGSCEGEILFEQCGEHGFGYDPLFFSYDLSKSFGQASAQEKNQISHRGRALMELVKVAAELLGKD